MAMPVFILKMFAIEMGKKKDGQWICKKINESDESVKPLMHIDSSSQELR